MALTSVERGSSGDGFRSRRQWDHGWTVEELRAEIEKKKSERYLERLRNNQAEERARKSRLKPET